MRKEEARKEDKLGDEWFFFWMNSIGCREKSELGKKTIRERNVFFFWMNSIG
jgi:hypothetical protein